MTKTRYKKEQGKITMKVSRDAVLTWAPRIFGLGLSLFLGTISLDAMGSGPDVMETAVALAMGFVPAAIILVTVIVAWKHELIGAIVFTGLAIFYAVTSIGHLSWILLIGGPLVIAAILYFVGWRYRMHRNLAPSEKGP